MDSDRTRSTFLDFFRDRGHAVLTSGTLLPPPGDPVLFTSAGMHPLTPYLTGEPHPRGRRLVNVQRCLRTTDLDEVGDPTHLTVFEMLGSWSLGDYPGEQSLRWGYELLRDGYGVPHDRLRATVFGGDGTVGPDTGSADVWSELGVPVEPTVEHNWWDNGPSGPCGPDSEIFVWTGDGPPTGMPTTDDRWVEVWNHVMMRYHRHPDGRLEPLPHPSIDTGMGFERLLTVLQGERSVYDCDIFRPWLGAVSPLWPLDGTDLRIVCDHLRSCLVMIGDGIRPANTRQGYVLRRLLRRVLTTLWRGDPSRTLSDLPGDPVTHTSTHFGLDLGGAMTVLRDEERRFRETLTRARPIVARRLSRGPLSDDDYHYLYDTHGLPRDLVDYLSQG